MSHKDGADHINVPDWHQVRQYHPDYRLVRVTVSEP